MIHQGACESEREAFVQTETRTESRPNFQRTMGPLNRQRSCRGPVLRLPRRVMGRIQRITVRDLMMARKVIRKPFELRLGNNA